LAAGTVEVGDVVGTLDEALSLVGTEVGRVVAEVAVVGEAGSAGWIDVDAADARRRAANFIRLETRLAGELFLGSLGETFSGLLSIVFEGDAKLGVDQIILL
jgi:hypothetical protein